MTWISLSSRCESSKIHAPKQCRSSNKMMVIEGTVAAKNVDDHELRDYHSCWTVDSNSSVSRDIDNDGDLVFRIGQIACCPAGGDVGETNSSIPVDIKLTVGDDQDHVIVGNTESLRSCGKSKPLRITIKLSSAKYKGLKMYDYTKPVARCVVTNDTNRSNLDGKPINVTVDDIIQCSLYMDVSVERARCVLSHASAYLAWSVACPGKASAVSDMNMTMMDSSYSKSIYVANISSPGCVIHVSGRYMQPLASKWTKMTVEGNAFHVTLETNRLNTESTHWTEMTVEITNVTTTGSETSGPSTSAGSTERTTVTVESTNVTTTGAETSNMQMDAQSTTWIVPTVVIILVAVTVVTIVVVAVRFRRYIWLRHNRFSNTIRLESIDQTTTAASNQELNSGQFSSGKKDRQRVIKVSCLFSEKDLWVREELLPRLKYYENIELSSYPLAGLSKTKAITKQVKGSNKIIVVVSQNYLREEMTEFAIVKAKMESIRNRSVVCIPIHLDDSQMPEEIEDIYKLRPDSEDLWRRLPDAINQSE